MNNERHDAHGEHRDPRRPQDDREFDGISAEEAARWSRARDFADYQERRQYREDRKKFWWAVGAGLVVGLGNNLPEWIGRLWRMIEDHVR